MPNDAEIHLPKQVELSPVQISNALALELAAQLTDLPDILERYSLTKVQLRRILKDPEFKVMYAQAKAKWGADANAAERVATKSTMLVEDSLLEIYGILHDKDGTPSSKIAAFNALVDLSDASPKKMAGKDGEKSDKFSITINLSGGARTFDVGGAAPESAVIEHGD